MNVIQLPEPVRVLYVAHQAMCRHFEESGLTFTLDGKLVGDIAEALAAEVFGLTRCTPRRPGVDCLTRDHRTVQVKATGKPNVGPAFTPGQGFAEHLLFLSIDFAAGTASVVYNGPEAPIRELLPSTWAGTKRVPLKDVIGADASVPQSKRLPRLDFGNGAA